MSLLMTCHLANTGLNILGMLEVLNTSLQTLQWVPEDEECTKDLRSGLTFLIKKQI